MPIDNSLNVSELLRRLGVKGDSQGSAPLLESLRLSLLIGDLSDLVPPVGTPFGGASIGAASGVGTFNQWSLHCISPGGLKVTVLRTVTTTTYAVWVTDVDPFGAIANAAAHNFSFGQRVLSLFRNHVAGALANPPRSLQFSTIQGGFGVDFDNWVGPGQFFNIQATTANAFQEISINWKEYPGALNPGEDRR